MKTLARIVGGLIALVVIAALAAPLLISSDTLKAQLVAQVKKATGRTLTIKGKTHVTFLPDIAVTAEDVTLSNPEGFTTPYFIALKKLSTGAKLLPLLHGELLIDGITVDSATVNLEELKSGAKNWEFTADKVKESAAQATEAPEAQKQSDAPLKRFALGDIAIKDSAVNILKPGATVIAVSNIDGSVQGADANSPLKIELSAEYREEDVSLAVDLANTREFLNGKTSPLVASLKLPGASADFNGEARMDGTVAAKGKLNVSTASLPKVLGWATGKQPAGTLPQQVKITAMLDESGNVARLSDANFHADDLSAQGQLAIDHGGSVPRITGSLKFGAIDLDKLPGASANTAATGGAGSSSAAPSAGWSSTPIDLSGLKAADADLALAWDSLKSGKFTLGKTAAQLAIAGGKLTLNLQQAQLYNGTVSGTARADTGGIGLNAKANGIDIDALMTALSGKSRLRGKTDLALNVTASGNNQRDWVSSLSGTGALDVTDGAVKGINIGQFLRDVKTTGLLFRSDAESTDFSELHASFTIGKGVLENKDLAMKSPALRVAGSGSANLPNKTLNYRLVPTLAGTSQGQGGATPAAGLSIPLVITGPWSNPSVTPDLAAAIQEGLQNPAALKQNIKSIKEGIKDFNSPKDLKRALLGSPSATPTAADTAAPTEKQKRQQAIQQGIGGLLKGLK